MYGAECAESLPLLDLEREPEALELTHLDKVEPDEVDETVAAEADEHFDDPVRIYLREVHKTRLLSAEEERVLARSIDRGDKEARARMITANLRLVVKMARHYQYRGLPLLDLIEEGNLGLIKAVDRFQVSKGCRFSTYASWWIRQSIERALIYQSRIIRLPVHISDEVAKLARATRALVQKLNREPEIQELADCLQVSISQVRHTLMAFRKIHSLEEPIGVADYCLGDTIEDRSLVHLDELFGNLDRYGLIAKCFGTLTDAERDVITRRFGLDDAPTQTLDAIGQRYGVTRERIRQIESKALQKLRSLVLDETASLARCGETSSGADEHPAAPEL